MTQVNLNEVQREEMQCDVLIVGGGSAGLSAAYHLMAQVEEHNSAVAAGTKSGSPLETPMVVVLEKGSEIGAHSLSGGVMNPIALQEMIPNFLELGAPVGARVVHDEVHYLSKKSSFKLPVVPPPFENEGNYILSIAQFNRWLGQQAEAKGVNIFPGFPAVECLYDENKRVIGVRTGDRGLDKESQPKANFEPGMIIKSKITIFADGTNSPLFKRVDQELNLSKGRNPKVFELGCKEVIQVPPGRVEPGHVIHTLGFPLSKSIGGTFIYTLPNDQIVVGLVAYLDTEDPLLDVHRELQKLKTHPFLQKMIEGGQVIAYGGKTLPAGGWYSMPQLHWDGLMVCGDAASMVDVKKLKGIHLAMKSGMLAAETAIEALVSNDFSSKRLSSYAEKIENSFVKDDLWKTRNFHQALSKGVVASMPLLGLQEITNGRGVQDPMPIEHFDYEATQSVVEVWGADGLQAEENQLPTPDGKLFFDKLSSVYLTGTGHDEDSPNHLKLLNANLCSDVCYPKYKSPCTLFCPAQVYEMVEGANGKKNLQINYTNCIHCQTCDLKCPTNNIDWTLPEGGGGPNYREV